MIKGLKGQFTLKNCHNLTTIPMSFQTQMTFFLLSNTKVEFLKNSLSLCSKSLSNKWWQAPKAQKTLQNIIQVIMYRKSWHPD